MLEPTRLLPREICFDDNLNTRSTGIDETHVRTLRNLYRNGVTVDPITVRKAPADAQTAYVMVDGIHRLTAFEKPS